MIPKRGKAYIPYGVNDVDCVLNANVLGVLASMGVPPSPEMRKIADWLLSIIDYPKCQSCAVYYPTANTLGYAIVKAWRRGSCLLEPAIPTLVDQLIKAQKSDGSWPDEMLGNGVQASLHAVNSLLEIQLKSGRDLTEFIRPGMDFLLSKMNRIDNKIWLDGGIVFSAGSMFKTKHVWESDAYTTALLLQAIVNFQIVTERKY